MKTLKTIINFLILSFLLFAASSQCFAEMGIEIVSKERAKELGMEIRTKVAGSDSVTVELAFKTEGALKSFSNVNLEIRDGAKVLVTSSLHEERPGSGRVVVSFSADHTMLDKLTLRVVVSEPRGGGTGYDLPVKDFVKPNTEATKSPAQTKEPGLVESEFASVEDAREIEAQLRVLAEKVAFSVVELSGTGANKQKGHGSGVIIHPSGLILTHGHHNQPKDAKLAATFPDGQVVEAVIDSVFSGRGRDFSLLKIMKPGRYSAVPLRMESPPAAGVRCFHFGYPDMSSRFTTLSTPQLRLGRIAGTGQSSTYANCLITSGDSGGPLFDFEGRLIGILDLSIGPDLRHPGAWINLCRILDGTTFLTAHDYDEVKRLGFTNSKRTAVDTQRHIANKLCPEILASARQATVEVLIDGELAVLGSIVDTNGLVLTKRSEIMTHRRSLLGKLTCRLFNGEEVLADVVSDSHADDVVLLQLPKRGLVSIPLSHHAEPRRGIIVVVPVPGIEVSETGVMSVDRLLKVESRHGQVILPVEKREAGVVFTSAIQNLDSDFTKLIRGTLHAGDVITNIDGEAISDLAALEKQTRNKSFIVGEFLWLTIRRHGVTSKAFLPIGDVAVTEQSYTDHSLRLTGFPAVIVHDTIVGRRQCGGPVVDLQGAVVGINIARFDRSATFAIPQQRIQQLVRELTASRTTPDALDRTIRKDSRRHSP